MAKLLQLLTCEKVIRDADTNLSSLINIFDGFNPPSFPAIIPELAIFFLFQKEKGDKQKINFNLKIFMNENEIFSNDLVSDFQGKKRSRVTMRIIALPLQTSGHLFIKVFIHDKEIASHSLEIGTTSVETKTT